MPSAMKFDILKFAKRLTDAGMEPKVAEALVEGLSEAESSELATKTDIARLEAATKSDIARLEAAMSEMKAELFRVLHLQAAGIIGLTVALVKLLPN